MLLGFSNLLPECLRFPVQVGLLGIARDRGQQIVDARRSIGRRQVQGHAFIKETREEREWTGRKGFYVRITDNIQF